MQTSNVRKIASYILWIVFLFAIALLLNLPSAPAFKEVGPDSGLFAYTGKLILNGKVPYIDFWDHKPPLVFYWNSLAELLFGQTLWAIWWFGTLFISVVSSLFFFVLKKFLGILPALIASLIFIVAIFAPSIYQGGNFTEIYGLLPQILIIWALFQFHSSKNDKWILVLGFLSGISILTKQTTTALALSAISGILILDLLSEKKILIFRHMGFYIAGLSVTFAVVIILLLRGNALLPFLNANLLHSFAYVESGGFSIDTLKMTANIVFIQFPLGKLALLAIASFITFIIIKSHILIFGTQEFLQLDNPVVNMGMVSIFIALPLEFIFVSLGGRNFGHYFIAMLPTLTIAMAYFLKQVLNLTIFIKNKSMKWATIVFILFTLLFLRWGMRWGMAVVRLEFPQQEQLAILPNILNMQDPLTQLEQYVVDRTKPSDYVLVWHNHPGINFVTNRQTSTKFLFSSFLFQPGGESKQYFDTFLNELEANPPLLILLQQDNSVGIPPFDVPDNDLCIGCSPEIKEGMRKFNQYVVDRYTAVDEINDWLIYRRTH